MLHNWKPSADKLPVEQTLTRPFQMTWQNEFHGSTNRVEFLQLFVFI